MLDCLDSTNTSFMAYKANKTSSIVATGNIDLPRNVGTYFEDRTLRELQEIAERIFYVMVERVSDGYSANAAGGDDFVEADARAESTRSMRQLQTINFS